MSVLIQGEPEKPQLLYDRYPSVPLSYFAWEAAGAEMRVRDDMLKTIVFIGVVNDRGEFVANGTGSLISYEQGGHKFQHVVTCWHVVRDLTSKNIYVRINNKEGKAVIARTSKDRWFKHPAADGLDGKVVDLCVVPVTIPDKDHNILHIPINHGHHVATEKVIKDEEIGIGDEVYSVGLFTSHYGEISNLPTVRCGNIAAMPHEPIETAQGFVDGYLIELHSVGGLSGSPAFVHMALYRVIDGRPRQSKEGDHYFLGLIQGHFKTRNPPDVVVEKDDDYEGTFNTGMSIVIPAKRIEEAVEHPQLIAEREEMLRQKRSKKGFVADSAPIEELPTTDENPQHREDFSRLLDAAARGSKPSPGKA